MTHLVDNAARKLADSLNVPAEFREGIREALQEVVKASRGHKVYGVRTQGRDSTGENR